MLLLQPVSFYMNLIDNDSCFLKNCKKQVKRMDYVYIGKIVNTHGIKGELRIISEFEYKEKVFQPGKSIYFGSEYEPHIIKSYRHHKKYEMITIDDYNDINEVLKFLKKKVYFKKGDLSLGKKEFLEEDIIGIKAYIEDKKIGTVIDIYKTGANYKVVEIKDEENNKTLIPWHFDFVKRVELEKNKIIFKGEMFDVKD